MCDVSDHAFRTMARRHGGPMAFTQMVSAEGLIRDDPKTLAILDLQGGEPVLGMQLFGCDPAKLAEAARRLQALGATSIDLNMGCPARRITTPGAGSALLRQPELCRRIFAVMRAVATVPLTAKMRWDDDDDSGGALAVARIAEGEGLDGLCLHARTRREGYSGRADWARIARLKASVGIPIVGNGDVRAPEDAPAMMAATGCDAVMVGRAAIGDPWLVGRALGLLRSPAKPPLDAPAWPVRRQAMIEHARLLVAARGEPRGLVLFRKHGAAYLRGQRGVRRLRPQLMTLTRLAELEELLMTYDPEAWASEDPADGALAPCGRSEL